MFLFFDTETTGFPNKKYPHTWGGQPHVVQLAALLTTDKGEETSFMDCIIRPEGYTIPADVAAIHKITTERAMDEGVSKEEAYKVFHELHEKSRIQIAHNSEFDDLILASFYHRVGMGHIKRIPSTCTMKMCKPILKIPPTPRMIAAGFYGHKSPNLGECYEFFFKRKLEGAHDALVDVRACKDIYFAAQKHGKE